MWDLWSYLIGMGWIGFVPGTIDSADVSKFLQFFFDIGWAILLIFYFFKIFLCSVLDPVFLVVHFPNEWRGGLRLTPGKGDKEKKAVYFITVKTPSSLVWFWWLKIMLGCCKLMCVLRRQWKSGHDSCDLLSVGHIWILCLHWWYFFVFKGWARGLKIG